LKHFNSFHHYHEVYSNVLAPSASESVETKYRLQLQTVPKYLLLWAKPLDAAYESTDNKYNLIIDKLDIMYGKMGGILANATAEDLYAISAKNNLSYDYNNFRGEIHLIKPDTFNSVLGLGSVIVLDLSEDLAYNQKYVCSGMDSKEMIIRANIRNSLYNRYPIASQRSVGGDLDPKSVSSFEFHVLAIEENYLTLENNKLKIIRQLVDTEELKNAVKKLESEV
jgi:hypothetical protein